MDKIITSQVCELKQLENLFIQLTYANCNLKCKHCYITPHKKLEKSDFISLDLIKNAIYTNATKNVENIYLTGGEPLLHPQFNSILRMCLKRTNTTIISNGININDKKARFFAKVEDEFENSNLYFKIGIEHFDELKVDETFVSYLLSGSSSSDNIKGRISRAREVVKIYKESCNE